MLFDAVCAVWRCAGCASLALWNTLCNFLEGVTALATVRASQGGSRNPERGLGGRTPQAPEKKILTTIEHFSHTYHSREALKTTSTTAITS